MVCRSHAAVFAILNCKGGAMHDRRAPRGGAVNTVRDYLDEAALDLLDTDATVTDGVQS